MVLSWIDNPSFGKIIKTYVDLSSNRHFTLPHTLSVGLYATSPPVDPVNY
jgi:hypothetical protein